MRGNPSEPVAPGFTPGDDSSGVKPDATKIALVYCLLFLIPLACMRRVEEPVEFEKGLLFDVDAECAPDTVSLELDPNTAAMLQSVENTAPLGMKASAPAEDAAAAAARRPFVVVDPNASPRKPANAALLATRRQAAANLPEGYLPADVVPVWEVVYPTDVLAGLDAGPRWPCTPPPGETTDGEPIQAECEAPAGGAAQDRSVARGEVKDRLDEVANGLNLLADRVKLARSAEEKTCIEDKLSALQVLQARLQTAAGSKPIKAGVWDDLVWRSRLAVGAALQCGSATREDTVTCIADTSGSGGAGTPVVQRCLRYEAQASLKGTDPTADTASLLTSEGTAKRILCVRAGAERMFRAARKAGDTFGVNCLGIVINELEAAERYARTSSEPVAPGFTPGDEPTSPVAPGFTPGDDSSGVKPDATKTAAPALRSRADELAAKADACVATTPAPGEPAAALNVELAAMPPDSTAQPVPLLRGSVPAPSVGGPLLSTSVSSVTQPDTAGKGVPNVVAVAVALAYIPEPQPAPVLPEPPPSDTGEEPSIPPDLPGALNEQVITQIVNNALQSVTDPTVPPPTQSDINDATNVIAQDFAEVVSQTVEEAAPVDETPPETALSAASGELPVASGALLNRKEISFTFSCSDVGAGSTPPSCSFQCKVDEPDASGSFEACESPLTLSLAAASSTGSKGEGIHTFTVTASDAAANTASTSFTWTVDTTAPETEIIGQPSSVSGFDSATFVFTSPDASATFECKLDQPGASGSFEACESPLTLSLAAASSTGSKGEGTHTFSVRSTDAAGNVDESPASYKWKVDLSAPSVAITSQPSAASNQSSATFIFTCSDPNSSPSPSTGEGAGGGGSCAFQCKLDRPNDPGAFATCTSPLTLSLSKGEGSHTFSIRATDSAGNTGEPTTYKWTIDRTAPSVAINSQPPAISNSYSVFLNFISDDSSATFECAMDSPLGSVPFDSCSPPLAGDSGRVPDGNYTFRVRAVDQAGNVSEPASYTWAIDTMPPTPVLEADVPASTAPDQTWAKFSFSCADSPPSSPLRVASGFTPDESSPRVKRGATGEGSGSARSEPKRRLRGGDDSCSFECSLDSASFSTCSSPLAANGLLAGFHAFRLRATDAAGNVSKPVEHPWTSVKIDTIPPQTTAKANKETVKVGEEIAFTFSCDKETPCTFKCNGSKTEYVDCTSPWTIQFSRVPEAPQVEIKAINTDGYEDPTPALVTFTVRPLAECGNQKCETPDETLSSCPQDCDTAAPETIITSKPSTPRAVTEAEVEFECESPNGTECTFECSLDQPGASGSFDACNSEDTLSLSKGEGAYTFSVRAKNPAGIADDTPAQATWTVDLTSPQFGGLTSAMKASDTSVLLQWNAATDNVSKAGDIIYNICRSEAKGCWGANAALYATSAGATSGTVTGLSSTGAYYYSVKAVDEAGNSSSDGGVEKSVSLAPVSALSCPTPGTICTVAGNGQSGFSGDNEAATSAKLANPFGVAVDGQGNLYIADSRNQRIRKVDSKGTMTTVAGTGKNVFSGDGGAATSAQLEWPSGVAVDASGNLYIADTWNHRIRKVDSNGIITTVAGTGLSGFSGEGVAAAGANLNFPIGVAADKDGNLYIVDTRNHRIRKVDSKGIITTVAGIGLNGFSGEGVAATKAQLNLPTGAAVDKDGNLYIADYGNQRIRKVDSKGTITTVAGNGQSGFSGDNEAATSAKLANPFGVAVDGQGNLYIADSRNQRIRKVDSKGTMTTVAGTGKNGFSGDGGAATSAQLEWPSGVAVDASGNLYIADTYNHRIRMVTPP